MRRHSKTETANLTASELDLDAIVDRFEESWRKNSFANIGDYLPSPETPNYAEVLSELIRLDLEIRWKNGEQPRVEEYLERFGESGFAPAEIEQLAYEEYRVRFQAGQSVTPTEYAQRFGIDSSKWPEWTHTGTIPPRETSLSNGHEKPKRNGPPKKIVFPAIGSRFHGFEIVGQLGNGAFGRVFLARQEELACRFVALKVTEESEVEPQSLARLQHTNIIPIYSLKKQNNLQSICMPFLGVATMRDLFRQADQKDSLSRNGQELIGTVAGKRASTIVATVDRSEAADLEEQLNRNQVGHEDSMPAIVGFNYAQTALWMAGRVASGLAYAHSRGVVHGDLKPANILISDDGEPLILDFHLSRSVQKTDSENKGQTDSDTLVGGTLPYMSARHLRSLDHEIDVNESCDVFSLGVVLYESLTGVLPYESYGFDDQAIQRMIRDRQKLPVSIREHNPDLTSDVNSIVETCLSPDPQTRYTSASELQTDIERHLHDLPLKFAPNRSLVERTKKWVKRHPKLTSATSIVTLALLVIGIAGASIAGSLSRAARVEYENESKQFVASAQEVRLPLTMRHEQNSDWQQPVERALDIVQSRTGGKADDYLRNMENLPADLRATEIWELGITEYWLAYRLLNLANSTADQQEKNRLLAKAIGALEFVADVSLEQTPTPIWQLKASVLEAQGQFDLANQIEAKIQPSQRVPTILERQLKAAELVRNNRDREAIELLKKLTGERPDISEAWMMMGRSYSKLQEYEKAEICYATCIEMKRDAPWAYFHRGVDHLQRRNFELAKADFDAAIEYDPDDSTSYLNRALAWRGMRQPAAAVTDLTTAIESGVSHTRAFYIRGQLLEQLGKKDLAQNDFDSFRELEPQDEISWLSRGLAQMQINKPDLALADFEAALRLNPKSVNAFQNIATVQAEFLDQTAEALQALTKIAELEPENLVAVVTRGVLHARLGNRTQAIADAKSVLKRNRSADILFRAAGVFALTSGLGETANSDEMSKTAEQDARIAVDLLSKASFQDPRLVWNLMPNDPDLKPIRDHEDYKKLLATLQFLAQEELE